MKIITDSSSDLTPELIAHFGVDAVIPMKISIDGREYRDKVDLTNDQFYQELLPASKTLPRPPKPRRANSSRCSTASRTKSCWCCPSPPA